MKRAAVLGLSLALASVAAPARAEEAAADVRPALLNEAPPSSADAARPFEPPIVVLTVAPELGFRRVTYRDRVSRELAAFSGGAMGLLSAGLELYPAGGRNLPLISNVGFVGALSRSLPAHGSGAGVSFDNLWRTWEVGGRYRGVFGGEEWYALSLRYVSQRFDFTGSTDDQLHLPSGTKQYWRPGLELRLPLGPAAIAVSGAWLALVMKDAVSRPFPRSTAGGFETGLALSYALGPLAELKLSGRYSRFFYKLRPLPGDPLVAGGALDETALLDLSFNLRG